MRPAPRVRSVSNAALPAIEKQIQAHRYLPERKLIAVLAEHAEDVAELLHRIRLHGIGVEMYHVVADTAESSSRRLTKATRSKGQAAG
jgi:hypothetical protein